MSNTNSSVLIAQINQSRKTVLELMEDQGFDVSGYANFSVNEVNAMKQHDQLDMLLESTPDAKIKRKVYVRYHLAKSMSKPQNVEEIIDDLFMMTETLSKKDMLYIVVKDSKVNDTVLAFVKEVWERDGIFVVIESIKCLQFNILKHEYVPEHQVMTEDEVKDVMTKFNITDKVQFPDISRFDPVARAIGLRPGQVCRILRPSKTSIVSNYYRLCNNV
jgi:DNA-directed RNA polymerase subunit H